MNIKRNEEIDFLTKLPNFISFFTDDFQEVYGENGCLLMVKVKPLKKLNAMFGRTVGDKLMKLIANYLRENVDQKKYRHEGNGFLIVYKEMDQHLAIKHQNDMKEIIDNTIEIDSIELAYFYGLIMNYDKPIRSVADYYQIFYDEYMKDHHLNDGKEMLHYILDGLSYRVNDMIRQYRDVKDFALYDDISELPNSKSANLFFEDIDEQFKEYAILFIDGDNLRKFNQVSYEHGNLAIKEIAKVIKQSIRKSDELFRWLSGDEFIVVLTDISDNNVSILAERIRYNVENHFINRELTATVSIGISEYPKNANSIHAVIASAETANKEAKANGKNKFEYYEMNTAHN